MILHDRVITAGSNTTQSRTRWGRSSPLIGWALPRTCQAGLPSYTFISMQESTVSPLDGCPVRSVDASRVASVAESLISSDEAADLADLFRLLGDPTRVRILFALLEAGELCVCDIAAVVDTSETKISQALRLLRGAGVVRNRRDGRNVFYRLHDAHVRMVLDLSRTHLAHGPRVLDR